MVLSLASTANASRRASLHGDIMLEDVTDVYAMPQLLLKYRNLMRIQMGTSNSVGDGLFIFGTETMAFALAAHRTDQTGPFAGLLADRSGGSSVLNGWQSYAGVNGPYNSAGTVFDAMLSIAMGDDAALGFRLGFGHGGTAADDGNGNTGNNTTTGILLEGGYSMTGDTRMDLGLSIAIGLGSDDAAQTSGSDIGIGAHLRMYLPMDDQVELGIVGGVNLRFAGITPDNGGGGTSEFDLALLFGAGPVYKLEKARISGYGFVSFSTQSDDPNIDGDNDATSVTNLTIPGIHMALEVDLTDWFIFRGGLEAAWTLTSNGNEANDATNGTREVAYGWSSGFGLVFDRFTFDLA
ncbi:MAG: hypothetical protein ACI9MR_004696, partial [Myxococcota bacterium]